MNAVKKLSKCFETEPDRILWLKIHRHLSEKMDKALTYKQSEDSSS